ncbi:CD109 antigen-like [Genypterus blacodes]|uniref:CD109 antigen-like n=1 Tax=Genypterus blacodes TaxID=154954 RepID=UPI003F7773B9
MSVFWALVVCVGVACSVRIGAAQASSGTLYLISRPDVLHAGTPTPLAVTVLADFPVSVTAEVSQDNRVVSTQAQDIQGGTTGVLTLPPIPRGSMTRNSPVTLTVSGRQRGDLIFSNTTTVLFDLSHVSTLIQTNRLRYQPEDTISVRVVSVQSDNTPYTGMVDVSVLDPRGAVVHRWAPRASLGIVSTEYVLHETSPLGQWTVRAAVEGITDEREVTVEQYEPPPFDVLVRTELRVLVGVDISGSSRALYWDGRPVKGTLSVSISLLFAMSSSAEPFILTQTKEIHGSTRFFFSKGQLQALNAQSTRGDNVAQITATVTDTSTGLKVNKTVEVHLLTHPFQLELYDFPPTLKPSLHFSAKLRIARYDGQPLSSSDLMYNVVAEVTQSGSKMDAEHAHTQTISVPEDGNVHIKFRLQDEVEMLFMQARFRSSVETLELYNNHSSPTSSYIQISPIESLPAQVGLPLSINIESTFEPTKLHYVVSSRGQVVAAGSNAASSFSLTPTLSWSPEACVTVYCVLPDGEVTSDAAHVPIHQHNNVSLIWSSSNAQPGEQVWLTVTVVEPPSQVGILVFWADDGALEVQPDVKGETECNIRMLSNANLKPKEQPDGSKNEGGALVVERYWRHWMDQDATESWMWLDADVSNTTMTTVKVPLPDRVISWWAVAMVMSQNRGLGFTPVPKQLMVSKDYSLTLDVPSFLIRGEEIVLEVNIFNHLEKTVEVIVLVAQSDAYQFVLAEQRDMSVVNAQKRILGSHEVASVLFPIRPLILGEMKISVDGMSAEDLETLVRTVLVKPEGVEQTFSRTLFLDLEPVNHNNSITPSFSFPPDVVPGSQRAHVAVVGDICALSINNLDSLVQMPLGCGEQNMILFAPSFYIFQYLLEDLRIFQDIKDIKIKALENMKEGYQRQLSYQRDDGSFSAFGASDTSGSIWLTAFVLRCFRPAQQYITMDQGVLTRAMGWLLGHQGPEGEFTEVGQLIHTEMQGGLDGGPVALTAYVLIALLEGETQTNMIPDGVPMSMARQYLENSVSRGAISNYSLCLVAYALALAQSPVAETALFELERRAEYKDGMMMWSSSAGLDSDNRQPRSAQIEMTSYVLLAYKRGNWVKGIRPMTWLSRQRNHLGGFGTTQDTIVALQALAAYAAFSGASSINVKVILSVPAASSKSYLSINSSNFLTYQSEEVPADEDVLINLFAEGRGFFLFQMNVFYNLESRALSQTLTHPQAFSLDVDVDVDDHDHILLSICTRLQEDQAIPHTGMVMLEVGLLSGFILAPGAANPTGLIKKVEKTDGRVHLYLDSLTKSEVCIRLPLIRQYKVAHVMDALVFVYDYYEPTRNAKVVYNADILHNLDSCSFCSTDCRLCRAGVSLATVSASPHSLSITTYGLKCLLTVVTALLIVA